MQKAGGFGHCLFGRSPCEQIVRMASVATMICRELGAKHGDCRRYLMLQRDVDVTSALHQTLCPDDSHPDIVSSLLQGERAARLAAFDQEFEGALGDYLTQHKRLTKIPGAVLRIQRWYQMCRVWRRYRRFLRAIKQFRGRGFRICFRAWQITAAAEVNCRSVVLGRIMVAWRVTSRNAAIWDEESAVLFLETSRVGGCPQQALFILCNDKLMWRRCAIEHNWGKGYRSGRPVPTREHAMVVQTIRRISMHGLKERVRRWKKRVMWCKGRRLKSRECLARIFDKRRKEKFVLKFQMWHR